MSAITTDVLVGSYADLSAQDIDIDGNDDTLATGSYYLRHPTASLSLIDALEGLLSSNGVSNPSVFVTRSLQVRITADATFAVTWTDTQLRDLLGFTGNLSGASAYTAANKSPLIWSPAYLATPVVPRGVTGQDIEDSLFIRSNTGRTLEVVNSGESIENSWRWDTVDSDRVWTSDELGGEFKVFRDRVFAQGRNFQFYEGITEDPDDSSTALTWPTPLGTYHVPERTVRWYSRKVDNMALWSPIEVRAFVAAEYSNS